MFESASFSYSFVGNLLSDIVLPPDGERLSPGYKDADEMEFLDPIH